MIENYLAIYFLNIIALIFLFGLLQGDNLIGNKRKKPFLSGIVLTILIIIAEMGTTLVSGVGSEYRIFNILCNVFGYALSPIIPITLISIFNTTILKKIKVFLIPTILNIFVVLLSPVFGLIFYIDENNNIERGSLFFLFVVVYIINILFLLIITWRVAQKYLYPIKCKIVILAFFAVSGTFIQLSNSSIYASWHCVTLSLFLLYIVISNIESSFDKLTKLYNRSAFEMASKRLNRKKIFTVIVMDINNFKEINDTHGHDYGDKVLKAVAKVINASFDKNCSCYRIGGDEFYVIRRDANQDEIIKQLKQMTNNLTNERKKDKTLPTIAYGYSSFQGKGVFDFQKTLKEADVQMYYHKNLQK